jgi:hypothetical protein
MHTTEKWSKSSGRNLRLIKMLTNIVCLSVMLVFGFLLAGCGKTDAVESVKKGHLSVAPNITLKELLQKYQYIDGASIRWEKVSDENKNEFVRATMHFPDYKIIAASTEKKAEDGMIEYAMLRQLLDEFYWNATIKSTEITSDAGITLGDIRSDYYARDFFDLDDHTTPAFFSLTGGVLQLNFSIDEKSKGSYEIHDAKIFFDFESPDGNGSIMKYQVGVPIGNELVSSMLVKNIDMGLQLE